MRGMQEYMRAAHWGAGLSKLAPWIAYVEARGIRVAPSVRDKWVVK